MTSDMLYTFIPVSVTFVEFQGHSGVGKNESYVLSSQVLV